MSCYNQANSSWSLASIRAILRIRRIVIMWTKSNPGYLNLWSKDIWGEFSILFKSFPWYRSLDLKVSSKTSCYFKNTTSGRSTYILSLPSMDTFTAMIAGCFRQSPGSPNSKSVCSYTPLFYLKINLLLHITSKGCAKSYELSSPQKYQNLYYCSCTLGLRRSSLHLFNKHGLPHSVKHTHTKKQPLLHIYFLSYRQRRIPSHRIKGHT